MVARESSSIRFSLQLQALWQLVEISKSLTIAGWLSEVERAFVDSAKQLPSIINNVRIHATRGIPKDTVFFLEDFLLAPPDEVAGSKMFIAAT